MTPTHLSRDRNGDRVLLGGLESEELLGRAKLCAADVHAAIGNFEIRLGWNSHPGRDDVEDWERPGGYLSFQESDEVGCHPILCTLAREIDLLRQPKTLQVRQICGCNCSFGLIDG